VSWLVVGALCAAAAVIAGAFGAHALSERLGPPELALWETAARYLMYGAFALLAAGLFGRQEGLRGGNPGIVAPAGWCLFAGTLIFSGTLFALALGGPRRLGAVTPVGGLLLIAGFLLFAWAALKIS
jgi:uncharacterized membrane protein YgdD (TMEM256/DUF423 family)